MTRLARIAAQAAQAALMACFALAGGQALAADPAPAAQAAAAEAENPLAKLPWQRGPLNASVGARATIQVPENHAVLAEAHGGDFLKLTGNPPMPGRTIYVGPGNWFAVMSFQDEGYIKDDEELDADALLETMKASDDPSNEERQKLGMPALHTEGWIVPPHYDKSTRFLEWGVRLRADGSPDPLVNYTVRMLGRHGYETVILVSSPDALEHDLQELKATLAGFDFNPGERYAEFREGDRVAEYGLGALVLGGAAAAAIKTGWWKAALAFLIAGKKLVFGALLALAYGARKFFTGRSKSA